MASETQLEFSFGPPPYAKKSDTSREASDRIAGKVSDLARDVYEFLSRCGNLGATCCEVENGLGMKHQTASARLWELEKAKLIYKSSQRRRTDSGRNAAVYKKEEQ